MGLSRSEPTLSMTGDASLFKSTGGLSSATSEGRITKRSGLSCEEVNCFKRFPQPSANLDEKVQQYWQHIGPARERYMERGLHTLPNDKGAFYNRPEFRNPMSATTEEWNARLSATRATMTFAAGEHGGNRSRRTAFAKPGGRWHPSHNMTALESEEEQLGRMIRLLWPSTRTQMARVGSSLRSRRSGTPASRPQSSWAYSTGNWANSTGGTELTQRPPPIVTGLSGSDFHKTVSFETMGSPTGGGSKKVEPVQWDVKSPIGGINLEDLRVKLKLLKRETEMHQGRESKNSTMSSQNALRMVKQASNVEGDPGATLASDKSHDEGKSNAYKTMKKASIAVQGMMQAMGNDPLASSGQSILSAQPERTPDQLLGKSGKHSGDGVDQNSFSLRTFRRRVLEFYPTLLEAFNNIDMDTNRKLNVKEFKTVLHNNGLCSLGEARIIFHLLDANNDGTLTMDEFHVGLESIAPVRDLESMRKRLLGLGLTTMMQALAIMDGGGEDTTMRPLNFNEFSSALTRVWIVDSPEHRAVWDAVICDPHMRSHEATVSLAELACALCAVSPCLLLEELRDRLQKRFHTLRNAWGVLFNGDRGLTAGEEVIVQEDFVEIAPQRLGMTRAEAAKAFTLLDIDGSGEISRGEFLGAMQLASPSLMIEEVRRKVRQRYISIDLAFRGAFSHLEGEELNNRLELSFEEFVDILEPLDIGRRDTKCLFQMMDGEQRGRLTLFEFFKGVRLVAPSCILEGIRLQLLQSYGSIARAFSRVPSAERRAPLDRKEFSTLMEQLHVQCEDESLIFDFLSVGSEPTITINQIQAALMNVQPGSWNKAANEDREQRAEREVKSHLAHHHRAMNELKRRVKLGLREPTTEFKVRIHRRNKNDKEEPPEESAEETALSLPKVQQKYIQAIKAQSQKAENQEATDASALDSRAPRTASAEGGPRCATAKSTYQRLDRQFRKLAKENPTKAISGKTTDNLRGYFRSAHVTVRDHDPLMQRTYTRSGVHREVQAKKRVAASSYMQAFLKAGQDDAQLLKNVGGIDIQ